MKKTILLLRNIFIGLFIVIIFIVIVLISYYFIGTNELKKQSALIEKNQQTRLIETDSIAVDDFKLNLVPVPQGAQIMEGYYNLPSVIFISAADSMKDTLAYFMNLATPFSFDFRMKKPDLEFLKNPEIPQQGYKMDIQKDKITIEFSQEQGLYYALISLKILSNNYNGKIPCLSIHDYPDLPVRGLLLDISRDKVPSMATLEQLVQILADLKYNHLELYIEGFSFAYPSFRSLWEGKETPITGDEIKMLDSLCKKHYIELVPNQNSLGHMAPWLATDQFAGLAECPDGYKLFGLINTKATLDPKDPGSLDLVKRMTDDLLPNFTSDKFNVNLDEPFELGEGKNKKNAQKEGVENIYLGYAVQIHQMVSEHQKQMWMWGDILLQHPEMIKRLPQNITILDWGYEASYPFEQNCKILQSSGHPFLVCPGTSSWTSIAGRTKNMSGNIASACINGVKYNASGMLLTDWGDMGHWQSPPVSYAGYVMGSAMSWNSKSMRTVPLVPFLDKYIFRDQRQIMGNLVTDLGNYNQYEEIPVPNMTTTMLSLQFGLMDKLVMAAIFRTLISEMEVLAEKQSPEMINAFRRNYDSRHPFDFEGMYALLDEKEKLLGSISLQLPDSALIREEYNNAIQLIRLGVDLQFYIMKHDILGKQEKINLLSNLQENLQNYLKINKLLWLQRNKTGGYERSTAVLLSLSDQINKELTMLNKNFTGRYLQKTQNIITTSIAVLYLKYFS